MRIAFIGKGGSGKTSLAAAFCRFLAKKGKTVLAVDADINQNFAETICITGYQYQEEKDLANAGDTLKLHVRGDNPRFEASKMLKTTPPGFGSRFISLAGNDPFLSNVSYEWGSLRLVNVGSFKESDLGTHCYHSKTGYLEILLNHLVDSKDEYVVVDMTAGADAFASGLFMKFDLSLLVVEPTSKSVGVYEQYTNYATEFKPKIQAIGNKVFDTQDVSFLERQLHNDLLTYVPSNTAIRRFEQGDSDAISEFDNSIMEEMNIVKTSLDSTDRDWNNYQSWNRYFHIKNCKDWANALYGEDLTDQIDPEFRYPQSNFLNKEDRNFRSI